jgi:hypothetical protein
MIPTILIGLAHLLIGISFGIFSGIPLCVKRYSPLTVEELLGLAIGAILSPLPLAAGLYIMAA